MPRDYKAEYQRRIAGGLARGLSRSQARGHPKATENPVEPVQAKPNAALEAAIRAMNQGTSMTAAARSQHVSTERFRRFITGQQLAKRKGRRWIILDGRPRTVPVITGGRIRTLTVAGYREARLVGEHHQAVGEFVRTNDIDNLKPFEGQSVRSAGGRKYPLETDPNALHRIAAMDAPVFHEIYEITSSS